MYSQVSGREGTMVTCLWGGHTLGVLRKDLLPSEWEGGHHKDRFMGWVYCVRIYCQVSGREGTIGTGL